MEGKEEEKGLQEEEQEPGRDVAESEEQQEPLQEQPYVVEQQEEQQQQPQQPYRQAWQQQPVVGYPMGWEELQHHQQQAILQQQYGYHHPSYQHPHHQQHPMEGVPLPPGIPGLGGSTDPLEATLGPFPCVKLRNLPFDATLEDILVLFQGLVVLDVLLAGQGEAFAVFSNPMDFQMALQRDRQTIGRRFVEINQSSRTEYYEAIAMLHASEARPRMKQEGGVRRGDTSSTATQQLSSEAGLWGSSTPGLGGSVNYFQRDKGDQQGGPADPMGGRGPIGMVPLGSGVGGPDRGYGPRPGAPMKRSGGGIQIGEHTGFLRMRGLPFSSTRDDIFKFFDGYNPIPDSIVLTYRSDGRATGEAYVGFKSPDDSKKAMDLHRKSMGSRYIELFISNKEEHGRAIQRFGNRG